MIIKGFKTLEGLEEKLRAVPEEKRKVIVLVGRHPNEGTINIANRHHESWEKHGAVVVRIPGEWTQHFAWKLGMDKNWSLQQIKRFYDTKPDDVEVARVLFSGLKVPVVNFHASGSIHNDGETQLSIIPGIFQDFRTTVEFYYRGQPAGRTKMRRHWNQFDPGKFPKPYIDYPYIFHEHVTKESIIDFSRDHSKKFEELLAHLAKTGLKPVAKR